MPGLQGEGRVAAGEDAGGAGHRPRRSGRGRSGSALGVGVVAHRAARGGRGRRWWAERVCSRRRRSMARRRATVVSHAARAGRDAPLAATRRRRRRTRPATASSASARSPPTCPASVARSVVHSSRYARSRAEVRRPSSRSTAQASCSWTGQGPDLDRAVGARTASSSPIDGGVEVGDVEDVVAEERLLRLGEGAVGEDRARRRRARTVVAVDSSSRPWQATSAPDSASSPVSGAPLGHLGVELGRALGSGPTPGT